MRFICVELRMKIMFLFLQLLIDNTHLIFCSFIYATGWKESVSASANYFLWDISSSCRSASQRQCWSSHMWWGTNKTHFNSFPLYVLLRSAVGKTHDLRSDLWWTIPLHILLDRFGIPLGFQPIKSALARHSGVQVPVILSVPTGLHGLCFGFCFAGPLPQRSLSHGPLLRVYFGESLVVRLFSEIDHIHLSIEAQCVSHHYPQWTATGDKLPHLQNSHNIPIHSAPM